MRTSLVIIILFFYASCKGQDSIKEYRFPEVDWTLRIPMSATFLDSAQFDTIAQKAIKAINKTYDTDLDFKEVKPLFTIRQGKYNVLGSTISPYDSTLFKTWEESYSASKDLIMHVINEQAPGIKIIDTVSSFEIIDGLRFEKVYIKTFYPKLNLTMNAYWLYRKQNNYDLSINISYTEDSIGKKFLELIRSSKFAKQ